MKFYCSITVRPVLTSSPAIYSIKNNRGNGARKSVMERHQDHPTIPSHPNNPWLLAALISPATLFTLNFCNKFFR
ncbi:hypothetical protein SAMN05660909_02277 [Chitinophaga terrae (ex Kim and Jung 2007)]|uniref:Uncharacterized protein n=1 Tax=Chitinophaga terrae (ex Kim and Jung 2007) TaxID=408074 RepID=A0A1H4BT82_9BACT|nr:hypothetical protein [Chitinophaga terrae (ex Kim and Jung 2007)]SEA51386.1 hypothetical protein SAMN05660909_02277 [Chitinophaga terrae (ex Kim and Jung 2007)]